MKYHYQYVSKTSVRIELIPEDQKEKKLIEEIPAGEKESGLLKGFYQAGLEHYSIGTILTKINFMTFPKVALCSFAQPKPIEKVA